MDNDRDMIECVAKWLGVKETHGRDHTDEGYSCWSLNGRWIADNDNDYREWFLVSGCEKAVIDKLRQCGIYMAATSMYHVHVDLVHQPLGCNREWVARVEASDRCSTIAHALTLAVWRAIKAGKMEEGKNA